MAIAGDPSFYDFERDVRLDINKEKVPVNVSIFETNTERVPYSEKTSSSATILNNGSNDSVKFRVRIPDTSQADYDSMYVVFETEGKNILDADGVTVSNIGVTEGIGWNSAANFVSSCKLQVGANLKAVEDHSNFPQVAMDRALREKDRRVADNADHIYFTPIMEAGVLDTNAALSANTQLRSTNSYIAATATGKVTKMIPLSDFFASLKKKGFSQNERDVHFTFNLREKNSIMFKAALVNTTTTPNCYITNMYIVNVKQALTPTSIDRMTMERNDEKIPEFYDYIDWVPTTVSVPSRDISGPLVRNLQAFSFVYPAPNVAAANMNPQQFVVNGTISIQGTYGSVKIPSEAQDFTNSQIEAYFNYIRTIKHTNDPYFAPMIRFADWATQAYYTAPISDSFDAVLTSDNNNLNIKITSTYGYNGILSVGNLQTYRVASDQVVSIL